TSAATWCCARSVAASSRSTRATPARSRRPSPVCGRTRCSSTPCAMRRGSTFPTSPGWSTTCRCAGRGAPRRCSCSTTRARLGRNAEALAAHVEDAGSPFVRATHPSLESHRGHALARRLWFRGGYVELDLGVDAGPDERRRFAARLLAEARRRSVPLVAGASFGFDVTRVYVTAADASAGTPFVRVAAGTEHRLAVERMKEVLGACLAA